MSGDEELQDRLRRLARAAPREATAATERALLAKFRARRKQTKAFWSYVAEIAATLAAAAGLYFVWAHGRTDETKDESAAHLTAERFSGATGFVSLPYSQSDVPMEQPVIVRVRISASELGGMGFHVAPGPADVRVDADLLVGQDGVARAVRVVQ